MSKQEHVPPTLAAWSNAGLHVAQLESGAWVKFRYPDLSMLAGAGKVPTHLKPIALQRIAKELKLLIEPLPETDDEPTIDDEKLAQNTELNHWLVAQMVKAVPSDAETHEGIPVKWTKIELDPEQVPDLPSEDVELLLALAERLRDTDARGVVMGVVPLSRFARFREAHGCGPDCEACDAIRNEGLRGLPARLGAV